MYTDVNILNFRGFTLHDINTKLAFMLKRLFSFYVYQSEHIRGKRFSICTILRIWSQGC